MSESAPPGVAGNADPGGPALTPERIDVILADFRDWLRDSARSLPEAPPESESVDLFTLIAQFTALRQEVNLQTRAVRQQQEQTGETVKQCAHGLQLLEAAIKQRDESASGDNEDRSRPLLKALIDAADTQQIAARELIRIAQSLPGEEAPVPELGPVRPTLLGRLLGLGRIAEQQYRLAQRLGQRPERAKQLDQVRGVVEAAAAGLAMGLQRIERAMRQHDLEPISAEGRSFDPDQMEVIEVAAGSGRPAGEVVEEVRRGYLLRGRVFRFAQVKVAK